MLTHSVNQASKQFAVGVNLIVGTNSFNSLDVSQRNQAMNQSLKRAIGRGRVPGRRDQEG